MKKISEIIKNFTENLREKFTFFIDSLIPDEDITKTSILFWFIIGFTTIAIFWGLFAKIDMVVRAQGNVIPASKIQVAQAVYGGILEKISVSLGDEVKKGDILYIIDGKNNEAEYIINEKAYESTVLELETRTERVKLIEELVNEGAESKMRLLDERLALVDTQRRLSEISSRREALEFQKDQSVIRSPVDGIISSVDVTTEGQVLKPGQLLSNIVPKGEQLIIAAKVQTQDISFVSVGQNVKITFSAYDPSVYGTFNGKVTKVAATSTLPKEENSAPFYEALIEVDDVKINDIIIQSGMTVDTSIIGQKRTVWGYVFNPVTKLKRTAFREK
tara:strand:- start:1367 stop:2362 length:996 start_codon:yes stop_codon:yes gene_type:complete